MGPRNVSNRECRVVWGLSRYYCKVETKDLNETETEELSDTLSTDPKLFSDIPLLPFWFLGSFLFCHENQKACKYLFQGSLNGQDLGTADITVRRLGRRLAVVTESYAAQEEEETTETSTDGGNGNGDGTAASTTTADGGNGDGDGGDGTGSTSTSAGLWVSGSCSFVAALVPVWLLN